MAKVINTILNLKNNMSGGLVKVSKDLKGMSKEVQRASQQVAHMADNFQKKVSKMTGAAVKLAAAGAGIAASFALKTGLSEAMDLEGYRTQLETATKDTKRAAEVMQYAIKLANATPFEGGELVSAASSLEMFGLKSERWLPVLGDAAAGVNRSMADVQSGFIKAASTGDFASLRDTLGVTKEMVEEYSKVNFGKSFLNTKGQVTDAELLQDALEGLLNDRYAGGMEKLSKTTRGVWSTITGVTKNSLARIVGMQNDGTVKSGSLLDFLRQKATQFADLLQKWQGDGTLDRIAAGATQGFQKLVDVIGMAGAFAAKHKDAILTFASAFAGLAVGVKVAAGLKKAAKAAGVLQNVFRALSHGSIALSPTGWIVLGITALVTVFTTAYRKSETFRNKVNELWGKLKEFADGLKTNLVPRLKELWSWFSQRIQPILQHLGALVGVVWDAFRQWGAWISAAFGPALAADFGRIRSIADDVFSGLKQAVDGIMIALDGLILFLTGVFTGNWSQAWEGVKQIFSGFCEGLGGLFKAPVNLIVDGLNHLIRGFNDFANFKMPDWVPKEFGGGKSFGITIPEIPHFALGTQYFGGGLARINERGGEIVDLPGGSRVIPADKSGAMGGGIVVNITVQGNVVGNRQFLNEMGSELVRRLRLALVNV